jgi:hypothetical protein
MHNYLQDAELEETLLMLQSGLLYLRLLVVESNQNKPAINKHKLSMMCAKLMINSFYEKIIRNKHILSMLCTRR